MCTIRMKRKCSSQVSSEIGVDITGRSSLDMRNSLSRIDYIKTKRIKKCKSGRSGRDNRIPSLFDTVLSVIKFELPDIDNEPDWTRLIESKMWYLMRFYFDRALIFDWMGNRVSKLHLLEEYAYRATVEIPNRNRMKAFISLNVFGDIAFEECVGRASWERFIRKVEIFSKGKDELRVCAALIGAIRGCSSEIKRSFFVDKRSGFYIDSKTINVSSALTYIEPSISLKEYLNREIKIGLGILSKSLYQKNNYKELYECFIANYKDLCCIHKNFTCLGLNDAIKNFDLPACAPDCLRETLIRTGSKLRVCVSLLNCISYTKTIRTAKKDKTK